MATVLDDLFNRGGFILGSQAAPVGGTWAHLVTGNAGLEDPGLTGSAVGYGFDSIATHINSAVAGTVEVDVTLTFTPASDNWVAGVMLGGQVGGYPFWACTTSGGSTTIYRVDDSSEGVFGGTIASGPSVVAASNRTAHTLRFWHDGTSFRASVDGAEVTFGASTVDATYTTPGRFGMVGRSIVSDRLLGTDAAAGPSGPTLSAPAKSDTATTATGGFTTTGTDGTARMVWVQSAAAPTTPLPTNVKAGHSAAGNATGVLKPADLAITSAGAKSFAPATGMTAGLKYWGFVVHTNAAGTDSAVLSLGPVSPGTGRPVSDVAANGYTASAGSVLSDMLNEDAAVADGTKDASFISSPALSSSFNAGPVLDIGEPYAAGSYAGVKVRKWVASGAGEFRVNFLNDAGALMGQTAVQAMTTVPTTFTLPVTLSGTATRFQIIERSV